MRQHQLPTELILKLIIQKALQNIEICIVSFLRQYSMKCMNIEGNIIIIIVIIVWKK